MVNVLILADVLGGSVQPIGAELATAARGIAGGGRVDALVIGHAAGAEAGPGVDRLLTIDSPDLAVYDPVAFARALAAAFDAVKPDVVLVGYTSFGLDLGPALAGLRNLPVIGYSRGIDVVGDKVQATTAPYAGRIEATVSAQLPAVVSVMPGAFAAAEGEAVAVEALLLPLDLSDTGIQNIQQIEPASTGVDLTIAERIVCVGRGIGDADSISVTDDLRSALAAELAGSRPVIDAGWLPKERQVGKSGTRVKPKLYLSLGVSGAPEHLEGMSGADLIVAVNTDPKAPIFEVAHYGVVCDLFDFVEALETRLADT